MFRQYYPKGLADKKAEERLGILAETAARNIQGVTRVRAFDRSTSGAGRKTAGRAVAETFRRRFERPQPEDFGTATQGQQIKGTLRHLLQFKYFTFAVVPPEHIFSMCRMLLLLGLKAFGAPHPGCRVCCFSFFVFRS